MPYNAATCVPISQNAEITPKTPFVTIYLTTSRL